MAGMSRMPRFREFDVLKTAIAGVAIVTAALIFAFTFPSLPFVRGATYKALFTESGGMTTGSEVRVAGAEVGKVVGMELVGDRVEVTFTANGVRMGDTTTAAIKTGTLLGKRYLGLTPGAGPEMEAGETIPVERTTPPYSITGSVESVTQQIKDFDKPKLEEALNSFSAAFTDTPENFRATFQNVKALSQSINTRDQALRELLAHANVVSKVFEERSGQFQKIVTDGNTLLAELNRRKQIYQEFWSQLNYVTHEIPKFVDENNENLQETLDKLNEMLEVVEEHNDDISLALQRVSAFLGGLSEGLAAGPAFSANVTLNDPGDVFNYTDVLRQVSNPQAPRVPSTPGLPGVGPLPNPLNGPASGAGSDPDFENPDANGSAPSIPLLGGK